MDEHQVQPVGAKPPQTALHTHARVRGREVERRPRPVKFLPRLGREHDPLPQPRQQASEAFLRDAVGRRGVDEVDAQFERFFDQAPRCRIVGDLERSGIFDALVAAEFPPYAAAGQVRLLVESGPDRIPGYPAVPTFKELGYPLSVPIFYGIAGPAGMPADVIAQWEAAAQEMVNSAGFKDLMGKLKSTGSYQGNREWSASILAVQREMARLIPELGFKRNAP